MTAVSTAHFNKAAQLHRNGKTEEAIRELTLAIEVDSEDLKSYLALAAMHETRRQLQSAVDWYRKALEINIDDPQTNLRLGILLTTMGSYNAALTPLRNPGYEFEAKHHFQEAARLDQSGQLGIRSQDPPRSARISNQSQALACNMSRKLSSQF